MKPLLLRAVIQNHIKTSRQRNDKLVQTLVCVAAALRSAWNIIKIVNALDLKGYMSPSFNEGKITSRIIDFGQINDPALGQTHEITSLTLRLFHKRGIANP